MNKSLTVKPALLAVLTAGLAAGCVTRERVVPAPPWPQTVMVTAPPPAPLVEVCPVNPRPGYARVAGAGVWRGHHWLWVSGHWAHPPWPEAVWVGGHYEYHGGMNVYASGVWR